LDTRILASNTFEMEWPPRSGRTQTFPEVDRAEWFTLPVARTKILEGQRPLLDRLQELASQ
jgi:predicted NUDIX family NTP pyrophosphohydrolase